MVRLSLVCTTQPGAWLLGATSTTTNCVAGGGVVSKVNASNTLAANPAAVSACHRPRRCHHLARRSLAGGSSSFRLR